MKYGDTLQQRSIAAWQPHNIDYQDIKHFIKTNTTPGKGKAVCIPGQADTEAEDFENRLFAILEEQDERITWFVRSKDGEIQRRLAHLEQQIGKYTCRATTPSGDRTTIRRLERYGKAETDILKVGEEIQALSRFIGVQQEAFRKLIKKHKKWTGSAELGYRFDIEVRQRRATFADTDLKPLLQRYEALLHTVRTLYEQGKPNGSCPPTKWRDHTPSAAGRFRNARYVLEQGRRVDFDNLLATLENDNNGQCAVFWVHHESVAELQILLQQYTRSFNMFCRRSSNDSHPSTPTSPVDSSLHASQPDTFDIIATNADEYLRSRAADNGKTTHSPLQKAALHARGVLNDDVSLLTWSKDPRASSSGLQTCALKRKWVHSVFDQNHPTLSRKASVSHMSTDGQSEHPEKSVEELQTWLKQHSDVSPVAAITSQRARYFNIPDNKPGVVIAALDQSIQFQSGVSTKPDSSATEFPFAVLSIRQEGAPTVDLIKILNNSHLVERTHAFSLEYHAIWQARQPGSIEPPSWITLLKQDLRKVPQPSRRALRKDSTDFGSQSTTPRASTATSSEAGGHTDGHKIEDLRELRFDSIAEYPCRESRTQRPRYGKTAPQAARYWNEYDEPSDDDDQYVIYLDPNYESMWDKAWKAMKRAFGAEDMQSPEAEPLLYSPDLEAGSFDDAESSDDELAPPIHRISRIRSHALDSNVPKVQLEDTSSAVPRLTLICFSSATALLVVAFTLAATGRRKLHREVDAGVIFAIITGLTFAITGVATLYRSGERVKVLTWLWAGSALCFIGIASGGLLAWILS